MEERVAARVLLNEDDLFIQPLVAEYLREAGFNVAIATNADEAIALLMGPDHVDLLVTDVRMQGALDGLDLALLVRKQRPDMPMVITSGYANQLTLRLAALSPPKDFISKPYSLENLANRLHELTTRN